MSNRVNASVAERETPLRNVNPQKDSNGVRRTSRAPATASLGLVVLRKKGPEREQAARIVELRDIFRPLWTTGDDVSIMWNSIVPVTRDVAGTSATPRFQGGGIPATRIVTIPPKINACPMCNAKTDGSGNGEPREPRVVFHTSPFWVQKVRRVCGACHHRFTTSDGDVEQYLLEVHEIPAIRRSRNADTRRGQTWITFHMAMKAIASFMLTKNLHAVRRDFSRNVYENRHPSVSTFQELLAASLAGSTSVLSCSASSQA